MYINLYFLKKEIAICAHNCFLYIGNSHILRLVPDEKSQVQAIIIRKDAWLDLF